jgi:hypothetical protein
MTAHDIHMPSLMREVTMQLRVTGQTSASVRIWIGAKLIALAAWIMGTCIELCFGDEPSVGAFVIPKQMSVFDADFDWRAARLQVSLDGVEMTNVVAYDLEAGTVDRYRADEDGIFIREGDAIGLAVERLTGEVQVTLK